MNASLAVGALILSLAIGGAQAASNESTDAPRKAKQSKQAKQKGGASTGRSAPPGPRAFAPDPAHDASYRRADIDGDGQVSKAEAAGNETLVVWFDRADRDRDGKLSRKEYEGLFVTKENAEEKAKAREKQRASR